MRPSSSTPRGDRRALPAAVLTRGEQDHVVAGAEELDELVAVDVVFVAMVRGMRGRLRVA